MNINALGQAMRTVVNVVDSYLNIINENSIDLKEEVLSLFWKSTSVTFGLVPECLIDILLKAAMI